MLSSLRVRLAAWLLLPLSVFVVVCGYLSWRNAAAVADYVQDHDLLASAKVLSERLIWEGDNVQASIPPSALSLFASPDRDQVFLSVTDAGGNLLAGTPGFPLPAKRQLQGVDRAQWYDTEFNGLRLRAVVTERAMYDVGGGADVTIAVGKTTRSRDHMLSKLWLPTVGFLLIALVLAIALTTLALTWELRPVLKLSRQLARHDPLRLDFAVDARALHSELQPVAETINSFVRELRAHSEAQRRFIADAAHQLRTPLALQASQIEYARYTRQHRGEWETRRADMDAMWMAMQTSNRRLVDVTNKLLLLAQAEHRDASESLERVDLAAAALHGIEQLAALADRRRIDLGMERPAGDDPLWVRAQPALLDALVSNLVDNALRYTQEEGRVTVRLRRLGDEVELSVEDNGPGIPAEAIERVFERFYRVSQNTEGTGLGLAIVREIARAFGAAVSLTSNEDSRTGLRATVVFPGPV
ncbi:sensor histidine kinase [Variovorax sp. YR216]|uniref:sensor histidine kinase n=1 Tax=Variovorax sp. YR216 TaxID=1882828 RepID=UPI000897396D|nr:sensor histidine kinase N-terminal domain-containing protein [Variovorax sp. YR216]SEB20425.1 two-component system, OmpR family, sensor histidine kinase TctE [Variovorax sp. YR216]